MNIHRTVRVLLASGAAAFLATCPSGQSTARQQAGAAKTAESPTRPQSAPGIKTGGGNAWFDLTRINLGTFYEKKDARGKFAFRNPRSVAHKLSGFAATCACAKAIIRLPRRRYEILGGKALYQVTRNGSQVTKKPVDHLFIGPGEQGQILTHTSLGNYLGPRDATLSFRTSDDKLPLVSLRWQATGASYFRAEPPEINLGAMSAIDRRSFEVRVTSPVRADFDLVGHDKLPAAMQIDYRKTRENGRAVWIVKGTYGPAARAADQGAVLRLHTDADGRKIPVRLIAAVQDAIALKPGGLLLLGIVPADRGQVSTITLSPVGDFDLRVTRLEIEKLIGPDESERALIRFTHDRVGKDVHVKVDIAKGLQPTRLHGTLKIHLNHPTEKVKTVVFAGLVR